MGSFFRSREEKQLSTSANGEDILKVTDLNVKLQNQQILEHVNFTVKKGTTLAVLGPNGAGKSVLFKVLLNLLPHEGKVEWAEKVKIGYVPQNVAVSDIPISVREFLSIGKNKCDPVAALSLVKLNDAKILDKRLRRSFWRPVETSADIAGRSSTTPTFCCWMSQRLEWTWAARNPYSSCSTASRRTAK